MKLSSSRYGTDEQADIASALSRWYATQPSIRRLWAIENPAALVIVVTLEPTSDGDDPLPVWFAKNRDWARDLEQFTHREVHLKLLIADVLEDPHVVTDAALIAEVGWRESWITP